MLHKQKNRYILFICVRYNRIIQEKRGKFMNLTSKKVISLALAIAGAFLLLCTGFYTFALLNGYIPSTGHFAESVFSDVFLPLLYILGIVSFAVFGFLFRSTLSDRHMTATFPTFFASGFAALVFGVWLFNFALHFFREAHATPATLFGILLMVFAVAAIFYFLLNTRPVPTSRTTSVLLGMGAALFFLAYAFFAYFDTTFALNSPIKLLDQITVLVTMFFFLIELRFCFNAVSEAVYVPVCMATVLLAGAGGIGALIYNAVDGRPLIVHVAHDFLLLAVALYAVARLVSFLQKPLSASDGGEEQPTFEADGNIALPSRTDPTQETFDFDKENTDETQEESTPAPAKEEELSLPEDEAAIDFDSEES